ncbi:MAG: arsenate reductase ArsC [Chloroherpetonaceae bacterium]|nr:arsenate reductase ArsC [Chthonomonadaceae bacterium]MDW8208774.1 arsenate reductase ArsC [Chloroherpetonaceae bacterium]
MKTVLFVCVHNAGRSQMAEAFFNHLAEQRGLPFRALSAGTAAGAQINPVVAEAMREAGLSLEGHCPKMLTQEMVDAADRIITMGCGVDATACPARLYITEDWGLPDPAGQPLAIVRQIRDAIRDHVGKLCDELTGQSS